jgi:hypothetical protein
MNARTARLTRRFAVVEKVSRKFVRRLWNRTPQGERNPVRKFMEVKVK